MSFPMRGPNFAPGWGVRAPEPLPRLDWGGPNVTIHNSHITGSWKHEAPIVQEIQVDRFRHATHALTEVGPTGRVGGSFFGD